MIVSGAFRRYVLGVLTAVFTLSYLDRCVIMLLLQPIKQDLDLSDTQLGFLTGIAFGLFYATLGIPIARWTDRGNRVTIAALAACAWGLTMMTCLFVANFVQLLVARVLAAVGEAGGMPPTYSLLGDYFPLADERVKAMGVYWMAAPLAALIGFVAGGWLNERYGWRLTFLTIGVPGIVLGLVAKLTVQEPRSVRSLPVRKIRIWEVFRTLWMQKSSRHLSAALVLLFTLAQGLNPWYAAFMIRSYGMRTGELGLYLGVIFGVGGMTGIWLGGYLAARWFGDDEKLQMRFTAALVAALLPCFALFLLSSHKQAALLALIPLILVFNAFLGSTFALLQRLVADEVRATSLAVVMLLANLIGMGVGPQVVGLLSDWLEPALGVDSLRYAMLATSGVALWAAYHFWRVGSTVREDLLHAIWVKPHVDA